MRSIVLLATIASLSGAQLIPRDATTSSEKAPSTVYTFVGSGSDSKLLQLKGSSVQPKETSDSSGESALSQLLHASTLTTDESTVKSTSTQASSTAQPTTSSSSSSGDKQATSFSVSTTSSGAAGRLAVHGVAGGIVAFAITLL